MSWVVTNCWSLWMASKRRREAEGFKLGLSRALCCNISAANSVCGQGVVSHVQQSDTTSSSTNHFFLVPWWLRLQSSRRRIVAHIGLKCGLNKIKRVCELGEARRKLYKSGGEQEGFLKQNRRGTPSAKDKASSKA